MESYIKCSSYQIVKLLFFLFDVDVDGDETAADERADSGESDGQEIGKCQKILIYDMRQFLNRFDFRLL